MGDEMSHVIFTPLYVCVFFSFFDEATSCNGKLERDGAVKLRKPSISKEKEKVGESEKRGTMP